MKKRNRARRQSAESSRGGWFNLLSGRSKRHRKAWVFEQLEERHYFSATPVSGMLTPEQVTMGEMWWAFKQSADLSRYTQEQIASATQWSVWTVPVGDANALSNPYLGRGTISTIYTDGTPAADVIAQLSAAENVAAFYPLIDGVNAVSVRSPLDEPLFESQWHLRNTGQVVNSPGEPQELHGVPGEDINVIGAWNLGYSGNGVVVGVVDSGFQTTHPDLAANNRPDLSTSFGTGGQANNHGTAVAGIIGAVGNNNDGIVGIAYNVDLVNIDIGTDAALFLSEAVLNYANDQIDIYNMSLGEATIGRNYAPLTPAEVAALRNAVRFGRPNDQGVPLGNIFVVASGNDGGSNFIDQGFASSGNWDSANYEGLVSSRYTIGVGAIDHDGTYRNAQDGTLTNYPEAGSSVLVVAPTGSVSLDVGLDTGTGSGIWTTDRTGNNGYNGAGVDDGDFLEDPDYTSRFNGTSAAAPMVSGVIALMLEANPNLSYRDVQEILLRSARQNDPTNASWQTNLYQSWERPDVDLMGVPVEDPFVRENDAILELPDGSRVPIGRGFSSNLQMGMAPAIDNYRLYQMPTYENGAGYTVSDGRGIYSEEYGWAHGVVDAELAVQLAAQWHIKGQNLAPERSYTTFVQPGDRHVPAAAKVGPEGADEFFIIPGVWRQTSATEVEFPEFYAEFFAEMPFTGEDLPVDDNGAPFPISFVPGFAPPLMEIEWIEVKLTTTVDINELRIAIRSPDGTVSDLNPFIQQNENISFNVNQLDQDNLRPGTTSAGAGTFTFSTNRHWGERIDDFFEIDPDSGTPLFFRRWELIIENYGDQEGFINAFEVVFHGTEIGAGTERISGKVGLDIGTPENPGLAGDGEFNFARAIDYDVDLDGTVDTRIADPDQEAFGANFTVRVVDPADHSIIYDEFVTGADGNFYFDLAPGNYDVIVIERDGYSAQQDAGLDPRYQQVWNVTINPNDNFTRTAGRAHAVDDDRDGILDTMNPRYSYYNDVNFLMSPPALPSTDVTVSGFAYADINGDGLFNGTDTEVEGFRIFADLNRSGVFDQSEPSALTAQDGTYQFVVPGISSLQEIIIVAEPLNSGWLPTNPALGKHTLLEMGGGVADNINFGFRPPQDGEFGDPGDPGTIIGSVFNDRNGNGIQNASELGVAGVRVFVDLNGDGMFNFTDLNGNTVFDQGDTALEPTDLTNDFGGFFLADVEPGSVQVHIIAPTDWVVTAPAPPVTYRLVTLGDGGQVNNVRFGIRNQAVNDFGDLLGPLGQDTYRTRLDADGPRHFIIPGFQLGASLDGETNGQSTANADGDDTNGLDDENGVTLPNGPLVAGVVNTLQVSVFGVGGYLNAWMDFNRDGDFDDAGEHVPLSTGSIGNATVDLDLNPGTHTIVFSAPANMAPGNIPARFRWGTAGLDYFGAAPIGEVEDYLLANSSQPPVVIGLPGDYDGSNYVDAADYAVWKAAYSTQDLAADGNGDGKVDAGDYVVWRNHLGQGIPLQASGGGGLMTELAAPLGESTTAEVPSPSLVGLQFATLVVPLDQASADLTLGDATVGGSSSDELELLDSVLADLGLPADDDDADMSALLSGDDADETEADDPFIAAFDAVTNWRYGL